MAAWWVGYTSRTATLVGSSFGERARSLSTCLGFHLNSTEQLIPQPAISLAMPHSPRMTPIPAMRLERFLELHAMRAEMVVGLFSTARRNHRSLVENSQRTVVLLWPLTGCIMPLLRRMGCVSIRSRPQNRSAFRAVDRPYVHDPAFGSLRCKFRRRWSRRRIGKHPLVTGKWPAHHSRKPL